MAKRETTKPFTTATPGDGGVPQGRPGDRPGGRHGGATLADPLGTLERLKESEGGRAAGKNPGVKRTDAAFPGEKK